MARDGYISRMTGELRDLMAKLELSLVETVAHLDDAKADRLLVAARNLERRIEAFRDAPAFVANIAAEGSSIDPPARSVSPPPDSPWRRSRRHPGPPGIRVMVPLIITRMPKA